MIFQNIVWVVYIIFTTTILRCGAGDSVENLQEAKNIAEATVLSFINIFDSCFDTAMPNKQFQHDNLAKYVYYPPKTTVGLPPKFTGNRKFFANMLSTTAFKEMLARDEDELVKNMISKMKFCDEAVMDQNLLKDFYDREVDQSKLR